MIESATLSLAAEGGHNFDAFLARPADGRRSGIVMIHDMFGLNASIREIAGEFAARGHAVLVPNMFSRSHNPNPLAYDEEQHAAAWERLKAVDLDAACEDISAAARWLRRQPFSTGKVAVVGFCGGGRMAFMAASRSEVDAAVALYGLHISKHLDELEDIRCPVQIHYGLCDRQIPQTEIDAVSEAVAAHRAAHGGIPIEIHLYPDAGHSFFNHVRPTFDAAAKNLATERVEALLAQIG